MKPIRHVSTWIYYLFLFVMAPFGAYSNNISIANVTLANVDQGTKTISVQFDLSWDNSWRNNVTGSWDAAWVFIKYKRASGGWKHATLFGSGHVINEANTTVDPSDDLKGAFVYRSTDGGGNVTYVGMSLRWDYGANSIGDGEAVSVAVYGIEMVYVPTGPFYLGDATIDGSRNPLYDKWNVGGHSCAGALIDVGLPTVHLNAAGTWLGSEGADTDGDGTANYPFPSGYYGFYIMKYEVSQAQYAEFLNSITSSQSANRYLSGPRSGRYNLVGSPGSYYSTTPDVACNYLSLADGLAYADWAALRPLTESEFEKACRGPEECVTGGEYAWGDNTMYGFNYTLTNSGLANEGIQSQAAGIGHAACSSTSSNKPLRCGIFAAGSVNHTRQETGAGYYGAMELSGNVNEMYVSISANGVMFTGVHGNGELATNGNHDVANWDIIDDEGGGTGMIYRGGGNLDEVSILRISDRTFSGYGSVNNRGAWGGARLGRSEPSPM